MREVTTGLTFPREVSVFGIGGVPTRVPLNYWRPGSTIHAQLLAARGNYLVQIARLTAKIGADGNGVLTLPALATDRECSVIVTDGTWVAQEPVLVEPLRPMTARS